ncbi:30S ribosomal protein S19 [Candidatus Pacearchaeota archaeon CG10_big_fil_rev_8_21_14_0_10_32_42]|nr:MAG: 30S ribosomal protein S19 [Candidatus Pacearchaeota archaeon CG10_big_fil_rev_8_21_14_0_10_32_42]
MEIKKKDFTYKGKTLDELKTLDVREFAKLLKSKPRRSVLRQFQVIEKFIKRSKKKIDNGKKIRTHQRDLIVVPEMVGMKINIHNGNTFVPSDVIGEMLGHRFGEFAPTRPRIKHSKAGVGATKGSKSKSKK